MKKVQIILSRKLTKKRNDDFLIAEYNTLRAEMLQYIQTNTNLFTFSFTAVSVLWVLGFETNNSYIFLLPILFLAPLSSQYYNNSLAIIRLNEYISKHIETKSQGSLCWETHIRAVRKENTMALPKSVGSTHLKHYTFSLLALFSVGLFIVVLLTSNGTSILNSTVREFLKEHFLYIFFFIISIFGLFYIFQTEHKYLKSK